MCSDENYASNVRRLVEQLDTDGLPVHVFKSLADAQTKLGRNLMELYFIYSRIIRKHME